MPKSDNKNAIKEAFPDVFVDEFHSLYSGNGVDYVIEDGMIRLQGFYTAADVIPTGDAVIRHMVQSITDYLNGTTTKVYVLLLDNISYVFKIKGIEHSKKAQQKQVIPAPNPQPNEDFLPMDKPIPYSWASLMANRKSRKYLINQITQELVNNFYPPCGKMLIIDGGLSNDDSLPVHLF